MIRNQPRATQLGWLLVTLLALVAFVPSTHWAMHVTRGALLLMAWVYVWAISRPDRIAKHVAIEIEGVETEDRARFSKRLTRLFDGRITPIAPRPDDPSLRFKLTTTQSLKALTRQLRKAELPVGLLKLAGTLQYTTTTAQARMEVEVSGVATPNAKVFLPGLDHAIDADGRGRFSAHLPFSEVRKHASKGYLPAIWRKDKVEQEMRVPIPA